MCEWVGGKVFEKSLRKVEKGKREKFVRVDQISLVAMSTEATTQGHNTGQRRSQEHQV
jgi:hypothetical protein